MSWLDNRIFGRVRKTGEESPIDPRFQKLSKDKKKIYEQARHTRQELVRELPLTREDVEEQNAVWNDLMFALLETDKIPLTMYAADPLKFNTKRFSTSVLIAENAHAHDPRVKYGDRDTIAVEGKSGWKMNMDAPFGLSIVFEHQKPIVKTKGPVEASIDALIGEEEEPAPKSYFEPIATLGFFVDYRQKILFIDQLQGGGTSAERETPKGERARMQFEHESAAYALFRAARSLALRAGMRGIALRKPEANEWPSVSVPAQTKTRKTTYEIVAELAELDPAPLKDYYYESLEGKGEVYNDGAW